MKMSTISELKFSAADTLAFNSSEAAKALTYTVMHKLRMTLVRMGLTKNHHEPIGAAVGTFDALRRTIQDRLSRDINYITINGSQNSQHIIDFWGQDFDEFLGRIINTAKDLPIQDRVQLLNSIKNYS